MVSATPGCLWTTPQPFRQGAWKDSTVRLRGHTCLLRFQTPDTFMVFPRRPGAQDPVPSASLHKRCTSFTVQTVRAWATVEATARDKRRHVACSHHRDLQHTITLGIMAR